MACLVEENEPPVAGAVVAAMAAVVAAAATERKRRKGWGAAAAAVINVIKIPNDDLKTNPPLYLGGQVTMEFTFSYILKHLMGESVCLNRSKSIGGSRKK